jgi:hypothetical protein
MESIFAIPNALLSKSPSFRRHRTILFIVALLIGMSRLSAQTSVRMQAVYGKLRHIESAYTDSLYPAAVFAAVYQNTLRMQLNALANKQMRDSLGMLRMTEVFFGYFDSAIQRHQAAIPNPPAWEAAFRDPQRRSLLHSMLLGIHAHVYNDLALALMQSFDAAGLQAFRRDYFRLNRGFRCINRSKVSQLERAMQLKGWRKPLFRFGSRWMMRRFQHERRRAYSAARRGFKRKENGKPVHLVPQRRIAWNIRRINALFRHPPLHTRLDRLDSLSRQDQLRVLRVTDCTML